MAVDGALGNALYYKDRVEYNTKINIDQRFKMKIRIYYEDTDIAGIVYHANYIKYCERDRSEIFFKENILPTLGVNSTFVVKSLNANFLASVTLGDIIEVKSELLEMKNASFKIKQTIYKDEKKIFEMTITLAYISFEGKAQKLDIKTKELLLSLF